jgi:Protein of Unknown function (DUF2784)
MLYHLVNALFHVFHMAIIFFVMFAWIFPALRAAHLVLILLTLGSWFILGRWFGRGYCPVSDWHWKAKAALGEEKPSGTYIHTVLQQLTRRNLSAVTVDKVVVMVTLALAAISLALNLAPLLEARIA